MELPDRIFRPMWQAQRPRRSWRLYLLIVLLVLAAGLWYATRPAPEPLPRCAQWAGVLLVEDGVFYGVFVDPQNLKKLHALVQGLKNGTCRFPEGLET